MGTNLKSRMSLRWSSLGSALDSRERVLVVCLSSRSAREWCREFSEYLGESGYFRSAFEIRGLDWERDNRCRVRFASVFESHAGGRYEHVVVFPEHPRCDGRGILRHKGCDLESVLRELEVLVGADHCSLVSQVGELCSVASDGSEWLGDALSVGPAGDPPVGCFVNRKGGVSE